MGFNHQTATILLAAGCDPETGGQVVGFALLVLIAALLWAYHRWHRRRQTRGMRAVADRFSGHLNPGSLWKRPSVRIEREGLSAAVTYYSTGGRHPTYYTDVRWNAGGVSAPLRVRIYPEGFFSKLGGLVGLQDVRVGEPEFDAAFVVKTDDPEAAGRLHLVWLLGRSGHFQ